MFRWRLWKVIKRFVIFLAVCFFCIIILKAQIFKYIYPLMVRLCKPKLSLNPCKLFLAQEYWPHRLQTSSCFTLLLLVSLADEKSAEFLSNRKMKQFSDNMITPFYVSSGILGSLNLLRAIAPLGLKSVRTSYSEFFNFFHYSFISILW